MAETYNISYDAASLYPNGDTSGKVKFDDKVYSVTTWSPGAPIGNLYANTHTAYYGQIVKLTPVHMDYYRFSGYTLTGGGVLSGDYLMVTGDCTASARFEPNRFTARGTLVTANMLSGSWQGIVSAFPAFKVTAYTGYDSSDIYSDKYNYAVYGGTGTNQNNLTGQRGFKTSAVADNCTGPSAQIQGWEVSGSFSVTANRNINVATSMVTASAKRALRWCGPGQAVQSAANFIGTGANATASGTKTFTGKVDNTATSVAGFGLTVAMANESLSPVSSYSGKVKSWGYHRIMGLTGTWSATGYAK